MMGRITVVKSLILPNITYIASNMIILHEFLQKIKNIIYNYVWNGKRDMIKREVLAKSYNEGGLKMVNIDDYVSSLQIKFVMKLLEKEGEGDDESWKIIPKFYYNNFGKDFLVFRMNIDSINSFDKKILKKIPSFYQELLKTWIKVKNNTEVKPKTFWEIRQQIIWGNRSIKNGNKCLLFTNWIDSNILVINDLLDTDGMLSPKAFFTKLAKRENWIAEFTAIKKAIPKQWLNILNTTQSKKAKVKVNTYECLKVIDGKENELVKNKDIYKFLVNLKEKQMPIGFQKWKKYLLLQDLLIVKDTLDFVFFFLDENKFKMFRWKLLHFILPCNVNLKQWKIINTDKCNFCQQIEDYSHFFIHCSYNTTFWDKIYKILKTLKIGRHVISLKNLVFGYKVNDKEYYDLNLFLTLISFSLYKAHFISEQKSKTVDTYNVFKSEVRSYIETRRFLNKNVGSIMQKVFKLLH